MTLPTTAGTTAVDSRTGSSSVAVRSPVEVSALDTGRSFSATVTFPDQQDERRKSPVIVLLGWLHGPDKHLAKYSAFYNQYGCITVRVAVRAMMTDRNMDDCQHLLGILLNERLVSRNIIFHVFSNGGCLIFFLLLRLLGSPGEHLYDSVSIRGTIFDSAPIRPTVRALVLANSAQISDPYQRRLYQIWLLLGVAPVHLLRSFFSSNLSTYEEVRSSPRRQPELYLYSKADVLTCHKDVSDVVAHRRKLGVEVSEMCWEDSVHVAHMMAHRGEYIQLCLSFVNRCCLPQSRL